MRYFRAFFNVTEEDDRDTLRGLMPLHTQFDDKAFVLPYRYNGWCEEGAPCLVVTLITKSSDTSISTAQTYVEKAIELWKLPSAQMVRFEESTLEYCFMDGFRSRYSSCSYDEDQIKRLLNLTATCSFIGAHRNGMRESIVQSLDAGKAAELAAQTPYVDSLQQELDHIFASASNALDAPAAPAPISYIVQGNALSDADEAIDIILGALQSVGRIDSGHVFNINVDDHARWATHGGDNDHQIYLNSQMVRAVEGNTVVVRYGMFDNPSDFDVQGYRIMSALLDLIGQASVNTQLVISVPEGNEELIMRLRKKLDKPVVVIGKDTGTAMRNGTFQENLDQLEALACERGLQPDESMRKLLSKRMRMNDGAELENVLEEWMTYREARQAFPQYAAVIDEAIDLNVPDEEMSAQARLDSLIGLESVKEHIRNIILRVEMNQKLMEKGLPMQPFSMHMAFLGAPGTGKTEVARLYAEILKDHGVLSEGRLVSVSGGAGFNVKQAFEAAKGSVLFIDEAYGLYGYSDHITELIAQMENNRHDTVVILAGYEGHMNALLDCNPGFRSRLGFMVEFPDYTADELQQIFAFMCERRKVIMESGVDRVVRDMLARPGKQPDQGNARFVRKLFEDAVGAQQIRLSKVMKEQPDADLSVDDLRVLTVADVEQAMASLGVVAKKSNRSAREELNDLIGLKEIKELVSARMDFAKMQKVKRDAGMEVPFVPMHMAFKGNPGTGKTEVARLIGRILREEGVLSVGDFFECGKQHLVSPFEGMSAAMVASLFQKARGSVIFIDEAYSLVSGTKNGPADEAITAIVDQMEKLRDEVVVIFAGYTQEIEDLFSLNPGFASRVKTHLEFPDYTSDELVAILHHIADDQGYALAEGVDEKAHAILEKAIRDQNFGNGRFMRNLFENALVVQSTRLAEQVDDGAEATEDGAGGLTKEQLTTLVAEDFSWEPASARPSFGFAA